MRSRCYSAGLEPALGEMRYLIVLGVIVAASAGLGGWFGWRKSALDSDVPSGIAGTAGMLGRDYGRFVRERRRVGQWTAAALWSVLGAGFSFIAMVIIAMSLAPNR